MVRNAIDMHAHWVPPVVANALRQRHGNVPRIETLPDSTERLVMPIGTLNFNDGHTDASLRLEQMMGLGVSRQMLSLPGLFGIDSLPFDQAMPLVSAFNDACAELCKAHPDQFCGLAALPLASMDASVAELRRARLELGLLGAILPVDAFRNEATAARLKPIFKEAESLGAHFFVHPGRMPDSGPLPDAPPDHDLARRALAAVDAGAGEIEQLGGVDAVDLHGGTDGVGNDRVARSRPKCARIRDFQRPSGDGRNTSPCRVVGVDFQDTIVVLAKGIARRL